MLLIIILMGVSGSGKTTVGQGLAKSLGWRFVEGDDLHSPNNIAKMSQGIPLTDRDRLPWLQRLRDCIEELQRQHTSAIVTCSALKQRYREQLLPRPDNSIQFVYLKSDATTLRSRLQQRQNHFMKADMLHSQLETLEEPDATIVIEMDETTTPEQTVTNILARLSLL